ncbi:MAG: hypothetical protein IJA34_13710 [Lachnospiraceae bacterium]|nr:hypothetical protein [Lachnospiraceae bacterium]
MRVTEKLLKENNKPKIDRNLEPETVEMYMEREKNKEPINKRQSVFQSKFEKGINSNKSVFDRQAIFRTND